MKTVQKFREGPTRLFMLSLVPLALGLLVSLCSADCGDGRLDLPVEECDDGNFVNGDGCSNCNIDRFYVCVEVPGRPSHCLST